MTARRRATPLSTQIQSRQRVRDLAEVYTAQREVNAMLDLLPDDIFPIEIGPGVDITFLEPACGSGNFLVNILERKLAPIRYLDVGDAETYEHWLLRALASVYAIDICPDNVAESRSRMLGVLRDHYLGDANTTVPSEGFKAAVDAILQTNVLRGDTLADSFELVSYASRPGATFVRSWSLLGDDTVTKRDRAPVPYALLADRPRPVHRLSVPAAPSTQPAMLSEMAA